MNTEQHSDKSFWLATYGPYTPNPPVQGDLTVDVAIVGGGFTGLSTAYNLRKDNPAMRVAVLESEVIGYGASGRNGGFSMTLFGMEPSVTKSLLRPAAHRRGASLHGARRRLRRRVGEGAPHAVGLLVPRLPARRHDAGVCRRIQHDLQASSPTWASPASSGSTAQRLRAAGRLTAVPGRLVGAALRLAQSRQAGARAEAHRAAVRCRRSTSTRR